jgi:cytochrome bd ubiquinol oxidase subunit I
MTDLLAAILQMTFSLGFQIKFAYIGMVMSILMAIDHWYWLKTVEKIT